jgi:type I restriction enzyme S subunit
MTRTPLSTLAEITSGFAFSSQYFSEKVGTPLIRIRDAIDGTTSLKFTGEYEERFLVQNGDLLITMDGEFRVAEWRGGPALLNQRVCRIEPKNGAIDRNFLKHFLPRRLKEIEDKTPFVTVKHLSVKTINAIEVPNISLVEQKRIAAILDKADGVRRKCELAMANEFLKSVFLDMFGHPLDPARRPEPETLGQHCDFYAGNSLPLGDEFQGQDGGIFLLKVSDLNLAGNESIVQTAKAWAPSRQTARGGIIAPKGAIVFPKRGGAIATNKKRILGRAAALDPNLMAAAPKPESSVSEEYLRMWFELLDLKSISSGSAVPQLNKKDLDPIPFVVPSVGDIDQFKRISRTVDRLGMSLQRSEQEADFLFAALSQRAFCAEL